MEAERFAQQVRALEDRFPAARLGDDDVDLELRTWLAGSGDPLPWFSPDRVTPDEWFFVSTLYGEMTMDGQRSHIRKYFPALFVAAADRDMRNFHPDMPEFAGLRSNWMAKRLTRMGEILRERGQSMTEYTQSLRRTETSATPANPMPALDAIVADYQATGWKTLSVFIRDCVGGNCFPIDSRVERTLSGLGLLSNERMLVSLSLEIGRNPREVARLFYLADGVGK